MHIYKEHKFPIFKFILIAIIFFLIGLKANDFAFNSKNISVNSGNAKITDMVSTNKEDKVNLDLFWTVWSVLETEHVDVEKINYENMVYGAIAGMVNGLDDPYTVFMTPKESEEFSNSLDGTLEGIGAELSVESGNLVVVSPLKNSPAEKAGLLPGDFIIQVDGKSTYEMTLFEAIMKIRGEKGTEVSLMVVREDLGDPFEVIITRDSIDIDAVTLERLDDGIMYLSVNQFNERTLTEFSKYVDETINDGATAYIIDLRYNGGGYLDVAVELLAYFLPIHSEAVKIKQRDLNENDILTKVDPKIANLPLVVLVNEGSASASEIFAGAIQAYDRGIVMGTQTFGKGTVQELKTFKDGSTLRITIAKWFTPDDVNINETGLSPDIEVKLLDEDYVNKYDRQQEEAVKYLKELKAKG